ncbi:Autotransporter beta domain-containing protein [Escherichia coli]|nr:Autotransporter beta domain-containing protein [Escherichia coli]SQS99390.1 Autotransporter beta domain-containing protein [Escherichia coli]SQT20458.1 Autotransporter beta domain-containing protein [Escherichia coli]
MTSLKTSIKTITYLSDIGCLEIQGASLLSYNMRLGNGMEIEPCLKAAVRKEFVDDNRVKVNSDGNFVNDLSGRRGIYQAGIKASFSSTLSGHFGVGYSHGAGVESPWNAVAGVNWSF